MTQNNQKWKISFYRGNKELVKVLYASSKKEAALKAAEECRKVITDPVHMHGIDVRLKDKKKGLWAVWDAYELVRGIFEDWSIERPYLLFPNIEKMK
jgi:hypothetical protein